jgi:cobalamin biosynthesis Mg chelatase CobN
MTTSGRAQKPAGRRSADSRTSTSSRRAAGSAPDGETPQTTVPAGTQGAPPDDVQKLQQEIEQTREQLGDTVEQLVAKTDVKARAQSNAAELAGRVKGQAAAARARAAARAGSVRDQVTASAAGVRHRTSQLGSSARQQVAAAGAPVWAATPEPARQAVAKGASSAREHRVPLAVVAGLLVVGLLIIRWRTRR